MWKVSLLSVEKRQSLGDGNFDNSIKKNNKNNKNNNVGGHWRLVSRSKPQSLIATTSPYIRLNIFRIYKSAKHNVTYNVLSLKILVKNLYWWVYGRFCIIEGMDVYWGIMWRGIMSLTRSTCNIRAPRGLSSLTTWTKDIIMHTVNWVEHNTLVICSVLLAAIHSQFVFRVLHAYSSFELYSYKCKRTTMYSPIYVNQRWMTERIIVLHAAMNENCITIYLACYYYWIDISLPYIIKHPTASIYHWLFWYKSNWLQSSNLKLIFFYFLVFFFSLILFWPHAVE